MSKSPYRLDGWDRLTLTGRNAVRRWYRLHRRDGQSRNQARNLASNMVWGAVMGWAGWVK